MFLVIYLMMNINPTGGVDAYVNASFNYKNNPNRNISSNAMVLSNSYGNSNVSVVEFNVPNDVIISVDGNVSVMVLFTVMIMLISIFCQNE